MNMITSVDPLWAASNRCVDFIYHISWLFDLEVCIWIGDSDFVPKNGFTWEKPDKYRLKGIGVQKNQSFWNFQSTVNFVICTYCPIFTDSVKKNYLMRLYFQMQF